MIISPPLVPKDHILKYVTNQQLSAPEHSPSWFPRVTQSTLGLFAYPVYPRKKEAPGEYVISAVNPQVLNRWADQDRAWWVHKPGENAYFIDEISRKYRIVVDPEYDPRFKHIRKYLLFFDRFDGTICFSSKT